MKLLITLGLVSLTLGCTPSNEEHPMNTHSQHNGHHASHEHRHAASASSSSLLITTEPESPRAGQPAHLRLMIHTADGNMVREFDTTHEAEVHLAIVSDNLRHFAHVHPEVDPAGNLTITHAFPEGGRYRLFADYVQTGRQGATATGSLSVEGNSEPVSPPVPNAPGEIEADGLRATITAGPLTASTPARLEFTLRDDRDRPIKLEKFMGELGHLMFVAVGTWQYVHVHPTGGRADSGSVEFQAHFPKTGLYKGWAQFKHQGTIRIVPLIMRVDEPRSTSLR